MLRSSGEVCNLLRSGSINNRLLCEWMAHPTFPQLLMDAEIYVNGVMADSFRNFATYLQAVKVFCSSVGIDYDSLEQEEVETIKKPFKRSVKWSADTTRKKRGVGKSGYRRKRR